jgi:membrane protein
LYWSVVTLGPVLLTIALYLGEKMIGILGNMPVLSFLMSSVGWVGPILVQIILLGTLYMLMPNTKVSFRAAVGGAMVAVPLWLIVKWAFGQYIAMVVQRGSLYGALGSLPLFLMWLNFSWLIFLFGAELSHTAANLSNLQMAEQASRLILGPGEMLATAIAVGQPYSQGAGPVHYDQMRDQLNLPDVTLQRLLERLVTLGIVCPVESDEAGGFVLARPAERIKVLEILELSEDETAAGKSKYATEVQEIVKRFTIQAKEALGDVTLADVIK